MKCPVCHIQWEDARGTQCPQCRFDAASAQAKDPAAVLAARNLFQQNVSAYHPEKRVAPWDAIRPWIAVALGFLIFMLWLKACGSAGSRFMSYRHFGRHTGFR